MGPLRAWGRDEAEVRMTLTMLGEATPARGVVATTGFPEMPMPIDAPPTSALAVRCMADDVIEGAAHRDRHDVDH